MQGLQAAHTSGVEVLDSLIDGVRVGDNLVIALGPQVDGRWLVDRYVDVAPSDRLVLVDATGAHGVDGVDAAGRQVLDWSQGTAPDAARAELLRADERVGADGSFVVDSLSALARTWGEQDALDLFLWACPRLFRRRSIALWLLDLDRHDDGFVRRLTAITQVVVAVRRFDEGLHLQVVKADGRDPSVVGRALSARLVDGRLVDARPVDAERQRLGQRLRDLRTRRGVGQAELARRVGISPSALSQAERGVRAVSAETLLRIWEALGLAVDVDDLADPGYRVHRRGGQASTTLAAGVSGRRRSADPSLTIWQLAFAPRAAGRSPLFAVKATETVVVLRGLLQLELEGAVETLHEGDTLVAANAAITAWTNPADTSAEVLWTLA